MKILFLITFILLSNIAFAKNTCLAITEDKLCIQLEWVEGPYLGAYSKNIVKFKDLTSSNEDEVVYKAPKGSIQFLGWMLMHGHAHGTRPVETKVIKAGVYENSQIFYMGGMMGEWQFKLNLGDESFILDRYKI